MVKEKNKSKDYFSKETDLAIVEFQNETDELKREQIYVDKIQYSFFKLVENLIFVYHFHVLDNIDILKNDCVSFLFETLFKFDANKGSKAFSYFNAVAKNWFIQRVKLTKKKNRINLPLDKTTITKFDNSGDFLSSSQEDAMIKKEFLGLLKQELIEWRTKFNKEQEKKILEAIIVLFENPEVISLYNKKGIYLYLREISGCNTKQVVTNLVKFKKKYELFKKKYYNGEI